MSYFPPPSDAERRLHNDLIALLVILCILAALVAVDRWIAPPGCAPGMMEVTGRAGWYPVRLCVPSASPASVAP